MGELRESDEAGRYGGEEFVVLFPNTDLDRAESVAHRLKDQFAEKTFEADEETFQVTCSIGLSEWREGDPAEELIERADQALYRAKEAGRDAVRTGRS